MAAKKRESPQEIYQIKVTLRGTTPPVWRRLLVPSDMTLGKLHQVLQIAMGWWDCHLHDFRIGEEHFGMPDPDEDPMGLPPTINERTVRLFNVLGGRGAKAIYTYDFGDTWEHTVAVEKVLPPDPGVAYPMCTGGRRRCPPEDCGGPYGYHNLLKTLGDPANEEHESMLEWVGGSFDPEAFSVEEVNQRLAPPKRRRTRAVSQSI
jgi:hypothetical protein